MSEARSGKQRELEITARAALGPLLVAQPSWLGDVFQQAHATDYEEVTCVGLDPDRATLYAVVTIKREQGYGGDLCTGPGSQEYVRFFANWNGDGDFTDPAQPRWGTRCTTGTKANRATLSTTSPTTSG